MPCVEFIWINLLSLSILIDIPVGDRRRPIFGPRPVDRAHVRPGIHPEGGGPQAGSNPQTVTRPRARASGRAGQGRACMHETGVAGWRGRYPTLQCGGSCGVPARATIVLIRSGGSGFSPSTIMCTYPLSRCRPCRSKGGTSCAARRGERLDRPASAYTWGLAQWLNKGFSATPFDQFPASWDPTRALRARGEVSVLTPIVTTRRRTGGPWQARRCSRASRGTSLPWMRDVGGRLQA